MDLGLGWGLQVGVRRGAERITPMFLSIGEAGGGRVVSPSWLLTWGCSGEGILRGYIEMPVARERGLS